ncbi:MAG: ornithine carbamoyltransferase, partial [Candidatus Omnitrophica bacterium]|nr:ornithine carbamoyltransferase [Candidatus Omnitrophota bacterium]
SIKDLTQEELKEIFELTSKIKQSPHKFSTSLSGEIIALIFEKPSCRTQVSFEVGMYQLGGMSLSLGPEQIKLGLRESTQDIARTLSRYVNGIVLRTFAHKNILKMAECASIPVINALTDLLHPCQALADIYTVGENFRNFKDITLSFIGDGNNVCHSLLFACSKIGLNLNIATPAKYAPSPEIVKEALVFAKKSGAKIKLFNQAKEAVKAADVLYTDVWASMGQEAEATARKKQFSKFQINKKLLLLAKKGCLVMHCLPAHRGEEITDEVIDSNNSIVFDQAENRLHVQKAILIKLLGDKK